MNSAIKVVMFCLLFSGLIVGGLFGLGQIETQAQEAYSPEFVAHRFDGGPFDECIAVVNRTRPQDGFRVWCQ